MEQSFCPVGNRFTIYRGGWGDKEGEKKRDWLQPDSWGMHVFLFFQVSFTEKEMTAYRDESPPGKIARQSHQ